MPPAAASPPLTVLNFTSEADERWLRSVWSTNCSLILEQIMGTSEYVFLCVCVSKVLFKLIYDTYEFFPVFRQTQI